MARFPQPRLAATYSGVAVVLAAELEDLFVLGSEARERFVAEVSEFLDGLIAVSEALFEGGDLLFEPMQGSGVSPVWRMTASRDSNSSRRWA